MVEGVIVEEVAGAGVEVLGGVVLGITKNVVDGEEDGEEAVSSLGADHRANLVLMVDSYKKPLSYEDEVVVVAKGEGEEEEEEEVEGQVISLHIVWFPVSAALIRLNSRIHIQHVVLSLPLVCTSPTCITSWLTEKI
jgi:hypothetical protein